MRCLCLLLTLLCTSSWAQETVDLNVALMKSTFMLEGRGANGRPTTGTGFVMMSPFSGQAQNATTLSGKAVLITAAHVLNEMVGDEAVIYLRFQQGTSATWSVVPARFKIRRNGQPLWKQHPTADVAVMYLGLPALSIAVPTSLLANDEVLKKADIVPGVGLKSLGYPLGDSTAGGFPILRTGVIASYPIFPTTETKTFLFDFRVFKGNSGGPVYFAEPVVKGSAYTCCPPTFIMGLVSGEHLLTVPIDEVYESGTKSLQLSLAVVVHASLISQTIGQLPPPESMEANELTIPVVPVQVPQSH